MGVFTSAIKLQKYNLSHQQILDQTSYVMEYMSRTIRMAQKESSPPTCLTNPPNPHLNYAKDLDAIVNINGVDTEMDLLFKDSSGTCRGFFRENGQIKEYERGRTPEVLELTSNDLDVISLTFDLQGASDIDQLQPRVTIFMEVLGKVTGDQPRLKIQTTISQRNLDM